LGLKRNQQLQELTTTFILRRTGEVLESLLPPRHEYLVFIRLAPLQESLYVRFLQTYQEALLGAFSGALSLLALLRKLVNHPYLLHGSKKLSAELRTIEEMRKVSLNGASSSKFAFIEALLRESAAVRDKVLIVSSFTSTLQALERFCSDLGLASLRLDGETSDKQRMELVKRFNNSRAGILA
jgi:SNF2 family DNA or RNA helicase